MEDTDFDWLCNGLPADEAKRMRKIFVEWCDGDENGFPVQLALLTRAQWRAAALVPQAVNNSRKLIERHLAEYRQQTAVLVKNLSIVTEDQADELKNIVKAHTETVNQASVSIRNQLWETAEVAKQIRKTLDDGVSAWDRAKIDMEAGSERFQKSCRELDDRITWRELRRDWLTLLGLIAIGIVIGVFIGIAIGFKYH
jgi:gas vesicle protein